MNTLLNIEHLPVDGYRYLNYASLYTGCHHVLDTMRYERAFFVRNNDVQRILQFDFSSHFVIVLGKYDFNPKTSPSWTTQRLLSEQRLEIITDPYRLIEIGVEQTVTKRLKIKHVASVEGMPDWVLQVMLLNKAMPSTEVDASKLESAISEGTPVSLELANFCHKETSWTLPK